MKSFFITIATAIIFSSCGMQDDITKKDSPTSGIANLYFDEGLTLHIQNQIYTFKTIYKYANITLRSSNEKECIEALYNDSSKVIAISRPLTQKELSQFQAKNIYPQTSFVAGDAIAFVVSKDFADSTISLQEITDLLKGNDTTLLKGQHIKLVFDNANSGSTRQLKDLLIPAGTFGNNCSTVNNTHDLIKAIASNSLAIGVCDYAWLSDRDDTTTKEFLKSVKILAVSKNNNQTAYMPDQSNIATKAYPLCRTICIIRRSAEFSLGKGIETFIAGQTGQLMFLKQGLPPNRQEERLIEVDMTPLK
jgi:phosphate transport system substrate-binding protein